MIRLQSLPVHAQLKRGARQPPASHRPAPPSFGIKGCVRSTRVLALQTEPAGLESVHGGSCVVVEQETDFFLLANYIVQERGEIEHLSLVQFHFVAMGMKNLLIRRYLKRSRAREFGAVRVLCFIFWR